MYWHSLEFRTGIFFLGRSLILRQLEEKGTEENHMQSKAREKH